MQPAAIPAPIPGTPVDPPVRSTTATVRRIDRRSRAAGVGYRALLRFGHARATLLSAGTAYYVFLAVFALITLAFGLAALIGSQQLTDAINTALSNAFPSLSGDQGIDEEQLRSLGSTTSVVGLVVLAYSGSGAMTAASNSIHQIYGMPKDPRNFVLSKARLIAWMLLTAPLILLSFAPSLIVAELAQPALEAVGLSGTFAQTLLVVLALATGLALSFVVLNLLLSQLGGVRPGRRSRWIGAAAGAVGIEVLKYLMAGIVAWSLAKPQYGAFAAPIAMLFVLYLLALVTYASAALTAAIAENVTEPNTLSSL